MTDDELLTVEETATRLGISPATVRRRCASGDIPAQRVGRSWLVEAARLPATRSSRSRRRAATASGLVDFRRALLHLKTQDLVRDLWVPDVLRHEDDLRDTADLVDLAAAKVDLLEPFDPPIAVPVPKNPFFLRNATNLSLSDRLAYHGAVLTAADRIESKTPGAVYSARLSGTRKRLFRPSTDAWVAWRSAVARAVEECSGWLIETDITSFFDYVSHTILMSDLRDDGHPEAIISAIREALRTWADTPNTGLPQGPDASRLLANYYLLPVDEQMLEFAGVSYFRYMDDICIVAQRRHDAIQALKLLGELCRRRNLALSTKKTELKDAETALDGLTISELDDLQYAFDESDDPAKLRRDLHRLLMKSLGAGGVDSRRAKFSLYRLRALREQQSLGLVLRRLEDLAPLGWLVPAYLQPWLRRRSVQKGLEEYLADPERNTSDFLSSWLLAGLLDEPKALTPGLLAYARQIGFDRDQTSYHRALALNVLALGRKPNDIKSIIDVVAREYDPDVVRGALVALKRCGSLHKAVVDRAKRIPSTAATIRYLKTVDSLPSLIRGGRRISLKV